MVVTTRSSRTRQQGPEEDDPSPKRPKYKEESDSEFEEALQAMMDSDDEDEDDKNSKIGDENCQAEQGQATKKNHQDSAEDDDEESSALTLHVNVGKQFIVSLLRSTHKHQDCEDLWKSLADTEWQFDPDVCVAAISSGLPPSFLKRKSIMKDPEFLAEAIQATPGLNKCKELWKLIGITLRRSMAVGMAALDHGIPLAEIPAELKTKSALKKGLREGMFSWARLPPKHKADVEFALCAREKKKATFLETERHVTNKEKLWEEWACKEPKVARYVHREHSPYTHRSAFRNAPRVILSNKQLMLDAIKLDALVLQYVDEDSLALDLDFLTTALENNILALPFLPTVSIQNFPSIICADSITKYMKAEGEKEVAILQAKIPIGHWSDRSVVVAWLSGGGNLHYRLKFEYKRDKEIFLLHAKHYFSQDSQDLYRRLHYEYPFMSRELREDKEFIKELLCLAPAHPVFRLVRNNDLYADFELQLLACVKTPEFRPRSSVRDQIERQLGEYKRFFKGILCGTTEGSGSPLVLLNQGSDANIKKVIASFLDFPKGEVLTWLFEAAINNYIYGFNPLRWNY